MDNRFDAHIQIVASNLKLLRSKAKISQQELAYRSHLDIRTIQRLEKGQYSPTLTVLLSIAEGMGVGLNKLLKGMLS